MDLEISAFQQMLFIIQRNIPLRADSISEINPLLDEVLFRIFD